MRAKSKARNCIYREGKATGRKGMGMELALLVLFVVFACSLLMVSSALLGKGNLEDRKEQMIQRFTLDQLAEQALRGDTIENDDYAVYERRNNVWIPLNDGPALDPDVEKNFQLIITDSHGQVKLVVQLLGGVTEWAYR